MFSLCIPTIDRFDEFLSKYLPHYVNNPWVNEIVITDENGNDAKKIQTAFSENNKIKMFVNENRLGPFLNKLKACSLASNEWIVLMDSDNFASVDYFFKAAEFINKNIQADQKNVILAPCFAKPHFNYSHLNGFVYEKGTFQSNNVKEKQKISHMYKHSECLMNTGNYVLNKFLIDNLDLSTEKDNSNYFRTPCDVLYLNTLLFEQLNLKMYIVPDLVYDHIVHDGSIYTQTHSQFQEFNDYLHKRYRNLQ